MMYPHLIRLREPWQRAATDTGVRYVRHFNCPTGLDAREEVWLVVAARASQAAMEVRCNGQSLGEIRDTAELGEFEIKGLLATRNEIAIDAEGMEQGSVPFDEVRLEIRLGPVAQNGP